MGKASVSSLTQEDTTAPSSSSTPFFISTTTTATSKEVPPQYVEWMEAFFTGMGVADTFPDDTYASKDFYSFLISNLLSAHLVQRGRLSCTLSVLPFAINEYDGLHGGVVGAIAERVSTDCARTVVAEDKQLFLGELSLTYLSSARLNEMLTVDASAVRSGRNVTVVAVEFRVKTTGKVVYTARATFYHLPAAKL